MEGQTISIPKFLFCLNNSIDIIQFAQCTYFSGADRRIFEDITQAKQVTSQHASLLQQHYGSSILEAVGVEDSPYSIQSSIVTIGGKSYSNSFLNMLSYYLGSAAQVPNLSSVVELGPGYGSLARIIKIKYQSFNYIVVDLSERLLFSHTFLKC